MSDNVYRERARLIAYMAAIHPSLLVRDADPDEPDWAVLFIHTAAGQMSWHISPDDRDLFEHVDEGAAEWAPHWATWDGHTTEEKYARLEELIKEELQ